MWWKHDTDLRKSLQLPRSTTQTRPWMYWELPASCKHPSPADSRWTSLKRVSERITYICTLRAWNRGFCVFNADVCSSHLPMSSRGVSSIWCSQTTADRWWCETGCLRSLIRWKHTAEQLDFFLPFPSKWKIHRCQKLWQSVYLGRDMGRKCRTKYS